MFSIKKKMATTFLSFLLASSAFGATVAVIDTGTDVEHRDLAPYIWVNDVEQISMAKGLDEDRNGYVDDINGWNFRDNNNVLLNRDYVSLYDEDIEKMFHFQYLYELYQSGINLFDQEIIDWYQAIIKDNEFMMRSGQYGSYAHGTHVAGIVAHDNPTAEIMVIKHLGDGMSVDFNSLVEIASTASAEQVTKAEEESKKSKLTPELYKKLMKQVEQLAIQSNTQQYKIAKYLDKKGVRIANASYGTSLNIIASNFTRMLASLNATKEEILGIALYYMQADSYYSDTAIGSAPKTLFVVAAGNDGSNNDEVPVSPANSNNANVITVGATLGRTQIASFSNYGVKNVDVAAPGVGLISAAPGDKHVIMNGTSQAAPYVSKVASLMVDENPKLSAEVIKKIIIETVDKKDWLKDKVASSGIVNLARAVRAAAYTRAYPLDRAIRNANSDVADVEEELDFAAMRNGVKSIGQQVNLDGLDLEPLRPKMPGKISFK